MPHLHTEDKAFTDRLLSGDEAAYDELFRVHAQKLYRFALARTADPATAEDLVQTSLAKAIPKLADFRGEASLLTWLCSFCRFEIMALRRKQSRRATEVELPDDLPEVARALELAGTPAAETPEVHLQNKELAHMVRTLLDRLPGRYGDVLEWKYQEGLSVAEIGERLGLTRTAAQSMLARARQSFREGVSELAAAQRESLPGIG